MYIAKDRIKNKRDRINFLKKDLLLPFGSDNDANRRPDTGAMRQALKRLDALSQKYQSANENVQEMEKLV